MGHVDFSSVACGLRSYDSWALEYRLNSCGTWAQLLRGMWNLPAWGLNPYLLHWQANSLPQSHQGTPQSELYIIVLVLPNIKMNPPQVYMCSPSWTLLPPPSPFHPSGSSQCTSPKHAFFTSWATRKAPVRETQVQSLGREDPLEKGNGNPLQYSCLENPMDRGAWWACSPWGHKSRTWLSN